MQNVYKSNYQLTVDKNIQFCLYYKSCPTQKNASNSCFFAPVPQFDTHRPYICRKISKTEDQTMLAIIIFVAILIEAIKYITGGKSKDFWG